jgi:hypothetical protein
MKISRKELCETMVWLKIIARKIFPLRHEVVRAISECHELIAIFVASANANLPSKINNQQSTLINPTKSVS